MRLLSSMTEFSKINSLFITNQLRTKWNTFWNSCDKTSARTQMRKLASTTTNLENRYYHFHFWLIHLGKRCKLWPIPCPSHASEQPFGPSSSLSKNLRRSFDLRLDFATFSMWLFNELLITHSDVFSSHSVENWCDMICSRWFHYSVANTLD